MDASVIHLRSTPFRRLFATNTTNNTAPALVDTLTEPKTDSFLTPGSNGVLDFCSGVNTNVVSNTLAIVPYGTDANNEAFDVWVFGWAALTEDPVTQWHPTLLCKFTATLSSSAPGVASGIIDASNYFADTLSDPTGATLGIDCLKKSPENDEPGMYIINTVGFSKIQIVLQLTTAASANALIKYI